MCILCLSLVLIEFVEVETPTLFRRTAGVISDVTHPDVIVLSYVGQ